MCISYFANYERTNTKRVNKLRHSLAASKIASVASTTVGYKAAVKRHYFATFIWLWAHLVAYKALTVRTNKPWRNKLAISDGRSTNLPTEMKSQLWCNGPLSTGHVLLLTRAIEFRCSVSVSDTADGTSFVVGM